MDWKSLLRALLELFGPALLAWLRALLSRAEQKLAVPVPDSPALAVHDLFAAARGELWVWQFARKRALAAAERVALKRAGELQAAAVGSGPPLALTGGEYDAVTGA